VAVVIGMAEVKTFKFIISKARANMEALNAFASLEATFLTCANEG
jgi:hypothetical protein